MTKIKQDTISQANDILFVFVLKPGRSAHIVTRSQYYTTSFRNLLLETYTMRRNEIGMIVYVETLRCTASNLQTTDLFSTRRTPTALGVERKASRVV